jgi:hypothetical protein
MVDQLGGMVEMGFTTGIGPSLEAARNGKLRAIAVSTAERYAALPNVPSVAEGGVPGFDGSSWQGLVAPAGLPKEVLARLNGEMVKALALPDLRKRLLDIGFEPRSSTPEELRAIIASEIALWAKVNGTGVEALLARPVHGAGHEAIAAAWDLLVETPPRLLPGALVRRLQQRLADLVAQLRGATTPPDDASGGG